MSALQRIAQQYYAAGLCPLPRVIGHDEPSFLDENGVIQPIRWGEYKI